MTTYFYSASENTFLPVILKEQYQKFGTFPEDATEINDEVAVIYMGMPPEGKLRSAGLDGMPMWMDTPPLSHTEEVAKAENLRNTLIENTNDYINSKQWPGKAALGRLKDLEKSQYNDYLDYLDALEAVETSSAPNINWPIPPDVQAS